MMDFVKVLLGVLLAWFFLWGQVFDRLISKAGFSGTVYRWVMGLSFASFVPAVIVFGIAVIFDRERSRQNWEAIAGLFVGLCIVINWIILTVLAWWPWPSLRKLK